MLAVGAEEKRDYAKHPNHYVDAKELIRLHDWLID